MCVVSVPNISVISQHSFNPGLRPSIPGIVEKSRLCVGLRKIAALFI
jgi:hypothetical protein